MYNAALRALLEDSAAFTNEPQLNITSRGFRPRKFVQRALTRVSHDVLERDLVGEVQAAHARSGAALQQLLHDHLGVFINARDAMRTVYTTDHALFTGDALESLRSGLQTAHESCNALVATTYDTHARAQRSRQTSALVDKLVSVISAPGLLYGYCGVRVALRRSAVTRLVYSDDTNAKSSSNADAATTTTATSETAAGTTAAAAASNDDDKTTTTTAVAAHALLARAHDAAADYVMDAASEELFVWYGTPLVRKRSAEAQRQHCAETANDEAAVLCLRRALLYLEEHYNLETGTLRGRDDANDDEDENNEEDDDDNKGDDGADKVAEYKSGKATLPAATAQQHKSHDNNDSSSSSSSSSDDDAEEEDDEVYSRASGSSSDDNDDDEAAVTTAKQQQHEQRRRRRRRNVRASVAATAAAASRAVQVHMRRGTFVFLFATALLRAALYLQQHLADELTHINTADTVYVEDTLSRMMDVAIVTVKLRHFAYVLQQQQQQQRLRAPMHTQQFVSNHDHSSNNSTAPATATAATATTAAAASATNTTMSSSSSSSAAHRWQHPVEFYVDVLRQQHTELLRDHATQLLRSAQVWQRHTQSSNKSSNTTTTTAGDMTSSRAASGANDGGVGGGEDSGGGDSARAMWAALSDNASLQFDRGMLGNTSDSFTLPTMTTTTASAHNVDTTTQQQQQQQQPSLRNNAAAAQCMMDADILRAFCIDGLACEQQQQDGEEADKHDTDEAADMAAMADNNDTYDDDDDDGDDDEVLRTTAVVAGIDMRDVLEASCVQLVLHTRALLEQLRTQADGEAAAAVLAQSCQLRSFAVRMAELCMASLEHVTVTYWGGIAVAIHTGVFDFAPPADTPLARMLAGPAVCGGAAAAAAAAAAAQTTMTTAASANNNNNNGSSDDELPPLHFLPILHRVTPATGRPPSAAAAAGNNNNNNNKKDEQDSGNKTTLRDLSVASVRAMVRQTSTTVRRLLLALVNRTLVSCFVQSLSLYTTTDSSSSTNDGDGSDGDDGDEKAQSLELHAAVLVEVLLAQWERVVACVSVCVQHMKIVVGESCSTATVVSEAQVHEAAQLLTALEQLRTRCVRAYLHGVGALTKAYVTALPLLQRRVTRHSLEHRTRARLSRVYVSSSLPSKLLNVLAVVADRTRPLLQRHVEVLHSADLFAARAEDDDDGDGSEDDNNKQQQQGAGDGEGTTTTTTTAARQQPRVRRPRILRRRHGDGTTREAAPADTNDAAPQHTRRGLATTASSSSPSPAPARTVVVDPITQHMADVHSALVQQHIALHETLLLRLVADVLLCFIDMLHSKCQRASRDADIALDDRGSVMAESMADVLCVPTTVTPLLLEYLLPPWLLELTASQQTLRQHTEGGVDTTATAPPPAVASSSSSSSSLTAAQRRAAEAKAHRFARTHLARVREHCQLALDAMLSMYAAAPQQQITAMVRRAGVMYALFDWQRVSASQTAAVRPYVGECVACIASALEVLQSVHQPALGVTVTQSLLSSLATAFVTALSSTVNVFELSYECSDEFLLHGTLLLEAEGLTILALIDRVVQQQQQQQQQQQSSSSSAAGGGGGGGTVLVLPELTRAREVLHSLVQALMSHSNAYVRNRRGASSGSDGSSDAASAAAARARDARRSAMVSAAVQSMSYMIEAVSTHLAESSSSSSLATAREQLPVNSEATRRIAGKLARRHTRSSSSSSNTPRTATTAARPTTPAQPTNNGSTQAATTTTAAAAAPSSPRRAQRHVHIVAPSTEQPAATTTTAAAAAAKSETESNNDEDDDDDANIDKVARATTLLRRAMAEEQQQASSSPSSAHVQQQQQQQPRRRALRRATDTTTTMTSAGRVRNDTDDDAAAGAVAAAAATVDGAAATTSRSVADALQQRRARQGSSGGSSTDGGRGGDSDHDERMATTRATGAAAAAAARPRRVTRRFARTAAV